MPLIFLLAFIPLLPIIMESLYFTLYGHPIWSMKWGNEVRVWGAILSPLCLVAIYFAAKHRYKWLVVAPALIFAALVANPLLLGVEGVPLYDVEELDLLGFWTTQWESWSIPSDETDQ